MCSDFSEIFDVNWFISYLSKDVKIIKDLPRMGNKLIKPHTTRVPRKCNAKCYQTRIQPILIKKHVSQSTLIRITSLCLACVLYLNMMSLLDKGIFVSLHADSLSWKWISYPYSTSLAYFLEVLTFITEPKSVDHTWNLNFDAQMFTNCTGIIMKFFLEIRVGILILKSSRCWCRLFS